MLRAILRDPVNASVTVRPIPLIVAVLFAGRGEH
jgi:hypothetical protein